MQIHGLNKTTLLDYPEHVAATIFTGGCNFRCPFCHNGELVLCPQAYPQIEQEEVLAFLKKRKGILTGICITGGEPTLQPDLSQFIDTVKEMGYLIKLDTNGYQPGILQKLLEEKKLDYVAMDIKNSPAKYGETAGKADLDMDRIRESVELLKQAEIPYEFRTTVVRELHEAADFEEIGKWLTGAKAYFLQGYQDNENVIEQGFTAYEKEEMEAFRAILGKYIVRVELRGIE